MNYHTLAILTLYNVGLWKWQCKLKPCKWEISMGNFMIIPWPLRIFIKTMKILVSCVHKNMKNSETFTQYAIIWNIKNSSILFLCENFSTVVWAVFTACLHTCPRGEHLFRTWGIVPLLSLDQLPAIYLLCFRYHEMPTRVSLMWGSVVLLLQRCHGLRYNHFPDWHFSTPFLPS